MREIKSYWITEDDEEFVVKCQTFGVRRLGKETGVNTSHISRWLNRLCGMGSENFDKIESALTQKSG